MITKRIAALLLLSCSLITVSAQLPISRHKPQKAQPQKTTPTKPAAPAKPKPAAPSKPKPLPASPSKPKPAPTPAKPAPAPAKPTSSYPNEVLTVGGVTCKFVYVAPGTFTMGATSEQENPSDGEKPAHQVTLTNGYYIGQIEVTQDLWKAVMGSNPSKFKGDKLPVENVSWNDCQDFISRLNSMTGKRFRLPTEAEWEYAARGGHQSRGTQYSGAYSIDNCAWYTSNSGSKTHPVATKQANELGIYDMSGNVWEWCQDWKGNYSSNTVTNPTGPSSGSGRVIRGGSWFYSARSCRVAGRSYVTPGSRNDGLGLRLVF